MTHGEKKSSDDQRMPKRKKLVLPAPQKMQLPMMPMIDITFQVLLFFIMVMQFRMAEGQIPADLPQQEGVMAAQAVELKLPIRILLRSSVTNSEMPEIEIERENVTLHSWDELYARLVGLQKDLGSDTLVIIRPRSDVVWSHVVNADNAAIRAKFKTIAFAPASEE